MPTSKGMPSSRRCLVALVVALATGLAAPAVAAAEPGHGPTTSSSTTTTTVLLPSQVPPPPAFTLPIDLGLQLLAQRDQAAHDIAHYGAVLPHDRVRADAVQQQWDRIQTHLERLDRNVRHTERELRRARASLRAAAVNAYMSADDGQLESAIAAITSANDALDANRTIKLITTYGDHQQQTVDRYTALKARLGAERARVAGQRRAADAELAAAKSAVVADMTQVAHARVRLTSSVVGILQFEKAATSASSPILGPSLLSARQLADYVRASGHHPRITVPIGRLAKDYIREGALAGVRGDVAFAQSILETDWFTFPGGGQLAGDDNNFAGIGACDSCKHGFSFATADIGVRAQMQALRIYVDPALTATSLKVPLVMPKMLNLGFRGKVQTWWDLWGTWATGAFYGQRVYDIYERMVAFAKTDPPPHPAPPARPAPPTTG